jgi:hypothetical protein
MAAVGVGALAGTGAGMRRRFERRIETEVDEVLHSARTPQAELVGDADLLALPEPVQWWLRAADVVGTARPGTVRLKQDGMFRTREQRPWMPFQAQQYFTVDPPGFLWWPRMRVAPFVTLSGRDRYFRGQGDMDLRVLSLVPVARKHGGGLNQGDLQRFLTEMIWFPAAAVSPYISWESVDTQTARATMTYADTSGSADFNFDDEGRVARMTAMRYNDATGRLEHWTIGIHSYGEFNGVHVAIQGDGTWNYESGDYTYIRWRITNIEFDRPER